MKRTLLLIGSVGISAAAVLCGCDSAEFAAKFAAVLTGAPVLLQVLAFFGLGTGS